MELLLSWVVRVLKWLWPRWSGGAHCRGTDVHITIKLGWKPPWKEKYDEQKGLIDVWGASYEFLLKALGQA